jgi:hypothetical protein
LVTTRGGSAFRVIATIEVNGQPSQVPSQELTGYYAQVKEARTR